MQPLTKAGTCQEPLGKALFNKLYVASDHAGFELKTQLVKKSPSWLTAELHDVGPFDDQKCDYPDSAKLVLQALQGSAHTAGVLICGSGQGMAMAANRKTFARAALCWNENIARLARQHNNANILCLGARYLSLNKALQILKVFLNTSFEGGRHQTRVDKL